MEREKKKTLRNLWPGASSGGTAGHWNTPFEGLQAQREGTPQKETQEPEKINGWVKRKFKTKLVLLIKYRGSCRFFLHPILNLIWHLYEPSIISILGGKCRTKKYSIISELVSPRSMLNHFEMKRDAEWSCKYSVKPAWLQHLCRKKRSANDDIIQNISVCVFLPFFLYFSLSLSRSLSLSPSLHCLDSKYLWSTVVVWIFKRP